MKSPNGMAMTASPAFTDAPDIHLLFMAGLVFLAGVAGVGAVTLLLLLAPFAALLVARPRTKKILESTTAPAAPGPIPFQDNTPDGGSGSRLWIC
ncbi:hypothetical protein QEH68_02170 [Paenarthrobacter sp. OM7]|uniref:hypothetical protein n=1 Tax=Paenarthrobacter sp. OM7 TaxID=3041264 RepID=UPI002468C928|nr:hypothetical protein [Paenarthrobacter sp. OM7]WGM21022.1 hypothetical protein QEH68_02170 [Paenarthrobacter sp. OM7]